MSFTNYIVKMYIIGRHNCTGCKSSVKNVGCVQNHTHVHVSIALLANTFIVFVSLYNNTKYKTVLDNRTDDNGR